MLKQKPQKNFLFLLEIKMQFNTSIERKKSYFKKSLIWKTIQKIMLIISKKSRQWFCLLKILIVEHSNMHLNGISVYNLL